MREIINELRKILAYKLLATTNLTGFEPEAAQINHLIDTVHEYVMGGYSEAEIKAMFDKSPVPGFDVLHWIESNAN